MCVCICISPVPASISVCCRKRKGRNMYSIYLTYSPGGRRENSDWTREMLVPTFFFLFDFSRSERLAKRACEAEADTGLALIFSGCSCTYEVRRNNFLVIYSWTELIVLCCPSMYEYMYVFKCDNFLPRSVLGDIGHLHQPISACIHSKLLLNDSVFFSLWFSLVRLFLDITCTRERALKSLLNILVGWHVVRSVLLVATFFHL